MILMLRLLHFITLTILPHGPLSQYINNCFIMSLSVMVSAASESEKPVMVNVSERFLNVELITNSPSLVQLTLPLIVI
jgi:hypothetical protein